MLLSSCANPGPTPDALESDTLPYATTTAPASETSVSVLASIVLTEETAAEARERISSTHEMRESDMRFGLMDDPEYRSLVTPRTGDSTLAGEGPINAAAFPASRTNGLGELNGFARDWVSTDDNYTIREELTYLASAATAASYAERLSKELTAHGISAGSHTTTNVVFVAEFGVKEARTKRACNSIAIAKRDRLVAMAVISNLCNVSTGPWAEILAANQLERIQTSLGL